MIVLNCSAAVEMTRGTSKGMALRESILCDELGADCVHCADL